MPATLNPIRKSILKKGLLNPKISVIEAQKRAGYSDSYARHSTSNACVKVFMYEISSSLRAADVTPDFLARRFDETRGLAKRDKEHATVLAADCAIAKFIPPDVSRAKLSGRDDAEYHDLRRGVVDITLDDNVQIAEITQPVVITQDSK